MKNYTATKVCAKKCSFYDPRNMRYFGKPKGMRFYGGENWPQKKYAKKCSFYDPRNRIVFQGTARLHSKLV